MTAEFAKSFRYNGVMLGERYQQSARVEKSMPITKQPLGMTRRGFLALTGNAVVAAGLVKTGIDNYSSSGEEARVDVREYVDGQEQYGASEMFSGRVEGYIAQYTMGSEVLFVDAAGRVIGTHPIELIDGISPGATYDPEHKIVNEGFAGNWLDAAEAAVRQRHENVSHDDVQVRTNWKDLVHAVQDEDESMTYENVHSVADIVHYFGDKPVRGYEHLSRIEFVRTVVSFDGNLSKVPVVVTELKRLMPGLCALESKFNDDVKSPIGARGIFEFKPDTWHKELGRPPFQDGVPVPLVDQLAAAGELFSKMYDRLQYWCYEGEGYYGENYLEYIKSVFDTQADFEKYFLTPCIILSYNTGERGASEVINAFAQSDEFRKLKESKVAGGYNTFQAMCDFGKASPLSQLADFKEEAPTYVQRAYAFAEILSPDHEGPMLVAQL